MSSVTSTRMAFDQALSLHDADVGHVDLTGLGNLAIQRTRSVTPSLVLGSIDRSTTGTDTTDRYVAVGRIVGQLDA